MKRFVIFLTILIALGGIYNLSTLRDSLRGFLGDTSYRKDDFPNAKKHYENILKNHISPLSPLGERLGVRDWDMLLEADLLYNLGNTLYRLGEKAQGTEKIKLWQESAGSYTKSLSIRTDPETEENLAFVEEKLKKEKDEQQKKQEEQKKKDTEEKTGSGANDKQEPSKTQSGSTGEKSWQQEEAKISQQSWQQSGSGSESAKQKTNTGSEGEKNKPQSGQNWSNQGSYNPLGGQNKDNASSNLSDADKQELKKYLEELKQFQKRNGKLLNPEKSPDASSLSDQIRNFFGSDSFFQDVLPSDGGRKDW